MSIPPLLLYTSGHRIDLAHRRIVATGAIAITAQPQNTEITIDAPGSPPKRTGRFSPTIFFSNLLPGEYRITARHGTDEETIWTKRAIVEEKRTTWFPFVRLFPKTPQPLLRSLPRIVKGIAVNESATSLVGFDDQGLIGLDLRTGARFIALERSLEGTVEDASWISDDVLFVKFANGTAVVLEDVSSEQPRVIPLPTIARDVIPLTAQTFLASDGDERLVLFVLDHNRFTSRILKEGVVRFTTTRNRAIALDQSGILWTWQSDEEGFRQRTVAPIEETVVRLVSDVRGETILAIDEKGSAWLLREEEDRFHVISDGIRDAAFSSDGAKLLLIGAHEISLYAVRERMDQPQRLKDSREIIVRLSEPILHAALVPPEEEHVAILTPSLLRISELDGRGGRNETTITDIVAFTKINNPPELLVLDRSGALGILPAQEGGILKYFPR